MRENDAAPDVAAFYVYILGTRDTAGSRTYVGWTTDLDRRLARHNAGAGARSTRGRVWMLLYAERYASRAEAMRREWHLKRDRAFRRRAADAMPLPPGGNPRGHQP